MIAYALWSAIILLLVFMIVLMICGVLYIKEHLARVPDSELPDGNIGDSTGDTTVAGSSVIPASTVHSRRSENRLGCQTWRRSAWVRNK